MSSVRAVRVAARRAVWAARDEVWDWVAVAVDERDGGGSEARGGRVVLR